MHWVAGHLSFEEAKYKKGNENDCKYQLYNIRRNKGKHLEQVPHCNCVVPENIHTPPRHTAVKRKNPTPLPVFAASNFVRV